MKILIIEDEEKLAISLKAGLKIQGNTVDIVTDGIAGENRILMSRNDYDVVILDLSLPGKNGFEICKNVRSMGATLPILILTARSSVNDKVLALESGADDYLVKPFALSELLARIHALVRRPHSSPPRILNIQNLSLNPETRVVTREGKTIKLTLKEFALLQYLMEHDNQVVTREEIFAHIWDFAENSPSNVIDAHMKNLRKKTGDDRSKDLIDTIRGVGYRIRG